MDGDQVPNLALPLGTRDDDIIDNSGIQNTIAIDGNVLNTKPKRPITAYEFFVQSCRQEYTKIPYAKLSRNCREQWNVMVDKQQFYELAKKDKQRYELEMQRYVPPNGTVEGRTKKRKQIKDPNAPKRPLCAFFWYSKEQRKSIKALHPEFGATDIAKELGRRWSNMSAEGKQKYEHIAAKDMQRYEQEVLDGAQNWWINQSQNRSGNTTTKTTLDATKLLPLGARNGIINQILVRQRVSIPNEGAIDSPVQHMKPRMPMSAYTFFMQSSRKEYSKIPFAELSMQDKQQFYEMAMKDKQRYKQEMIEYTLKCQNKTDTTDSERA